MNYSGTNYFADAVIVVAYISGEHQGILELQCSSVFSSNSKRRYVVFKCSVLTRFSATVLANS